MSMIYEYGIIFLIAFITFLLRYTPFLLKRKLEKYDAIKYLEIYLPASIMFILVLYTLKDISLSKSPYGCHEFLGILSVILIHIKYRNVLLSIVLGTLCYIVSKYYSNLT